MTYLERCTLAVATKIKSQHELSDELCVSIAGIAIVALVSVPKEIAATQIAPAVGEVIPPTETGAGSQVENRQIAQLKGYTGDECTTCRGLNVRYNGTCKLCEDCGTTTGCS